jgi:hypothetical protein
LGEWRWDQAAEELPGREESEEGKVVQLDDMTQKLNALLVLPSSVGLF